MTVKDMVGLLAALPQQDIPVHIRDYESGGDHDYPCTEITICIKGEEPPIILLG